MVRTAIDRFDRAVLVAGLVLLAFADIARAAPPEAGEMAAAATVLCDERSQIELLMRAFKTEGVNAAKRLYGRLNSTPNAIGEPTCNYQDTQGLVAESVYLGEGLDTKLVTCKVWAVRLTPPGNAGWIGWYECPAGFGA